MKELDIFMSLTDCVNCPLSNTPKVSSYITNSDNIDVCVIGQSPGWQELRDGKPFVGESGKMINRVILQYTYDVAYINVLACRPTDIKDDIDRQPAAVEMKSCHDRFESDVLYVLDTFRPRCVLIFGAIAKKAVAKFLKCNLQYDSSIFHQLDHPAYILRNRHLELRYITSMHSILKSAFDAKADNIVSKFIIYTDDVKTQFIADATSSSRIGVDIETNSLKMFAESFIIGTVAVSCINNTYFFDCRNNSIKEFIVLLDILKNANVQKIFADVLFDVVALRQYEIEVNNISDLLPLAFIYDNTFNEYSLKAITMRYMPELAGYKTKFQMSVEPDKYLEAPTEELMNYNCFDAYNSRVLYDYLYNKIDDKARTVFDKITVRLLPVLVTMKCTGIKIDLYTLRLYVSNFEERYKDLQKFFEQKYSITNINSTPQIAKWMFETLGLKPIKYNDPTKAQRAKGIRVGNPSTDKEVIEVYATTTPDTKLLYEARRISSLLTYMLPSIEKNLNSQDLIHPNYKHYGIQSFRLSCVNPNLQGISRDETGIEILDKFPIRRLFIARRNDSYIIEFDYSQQEVRIIAELAKDFRMLESFARNEDIHKFVASLIFNKSINEITKFERQVSKGCTFGAIFGVSAREMASRMHMTERQAKSHLDKFFEMFSSIDKYIKRQHDALIQNSCVTTILGRPRKFVLSRDNISDCKREAANHQIQAVASDITFLSLIAIHDEFTKEKILNKDAFIIHSIHDSILVEASENSLLHVIEIVSNIMSDVPNALGFKVKFPIDYKFGKAWGVSENLELLQKTERKYQ